jgi:O-antigen ligase
MLSQRVKQLSGKYGLLFRLVAAGGTGFLLGVASLWLSPLLVLGALAAILLILAVLKRPEIALLGILIATSSIVFENRLPLIPIGIGSLHIPDVILLALLGLITLRWLVEPDFNIIRTPLDWPLLAFYSVALLSTFIAVFQSSVEFHMTRRAVRVVTYYLTFFIVTNLVREDRQLIFLVRGLFLLATIVAAAMIAQFLLGESLTFLPGRVETLSTQGTRYGDITRILPPGISLIQVAFIATTATLVLDKFRPVNMLRFLQWGLLGLAVLLTFLRSYWMVVSVVLFLLAYLVRGQDRQRLLGWGLVVMFLVAMILLPVFSEPESQAAGLVDASLERLSTLVSGETLRSQESTFVWRYTEYEYALPLIASHPLLGLGLGARYRPWDPRLDWKGPDGSGFDGRGHIHNGHLWILLKSGLLGYISLVWLSLAFLIRGFKYWRRIPNSEMRGIVLGFTLTYLGVLIGAVVNSTFMQWFWTPVIGIMMGINEVALRKVVQEGSGVDHSYSEADGVGPSRKVAEFGCQ